MATGNKLTKSKGTGENAKLLSNSGHARRTDGTKSIFPSQVSSSKKTENNRLVDKLRRTEKLRKSLIKKARKTTDYGNIKGVVFEEVATEEIRSLIQSGQFKNFLPTHIRQANIVSDFHTMKVNDVCFIKGERILLDNKNYSDGLMLQKVANNQYRVYSIFEMKSSLKQSKKLMVSYEYDKAEKLAGIREDSRIGVKSKISNAGTGQLHEVIERLHDDTSGPYERRSRKMKVDGNTIFIYPRTKDITVVSVVPSDVDIKKNTVIYQRMLKDLPDGVKHTIVQSGYSQKEIDFGTKWVLRQYKQTGTLGNSSTKERPIPDSAKEKGKIGQRAEKRGRLSYDELKSKYGAKKAKQFVKRRLKDDQSKRIRSGNKPKPLSELAQSNKTGSKSFNSLKNIGKAFGREIAAGGVQVLARLTWERYCAWANERQYKWALTKQNKILREGLLNYEVAKLVAACAPDTMINVYFTTRKTIAVHPRTPFKPYVDEDSATYYPIKIQWSLPGHVRALSPNKYIYYINYSLQYKVWISETKSLLRIGDLLPEYVNQTEIYFCEKRNLDYQNHGIETIYEIPEELTTTYYHKEVYINGKKLDGDF